MLWGRYIPAARKDRDMGVSPGPPGRPEACHVAFDPRMGSHPKETAMNDMTMIPRLNEFLRNELSAVETYDLALRQTKHEGFGSTLRQLRDAHDRRIGAIRDKILDL